jgi:hypothetical protein
VELEARMRAEQEVADQTMTDMFQYMQNLSATTGIALPPPLFPVAQPPQFSTLVSMKFLVVRDIYSSCFTHAISSMCKINRRHQTTLMVRRALRRTSPTSHLADLMNLAVIYKSYVYETCETYVCECW